MRDANQCLCLLLLQRKISHREAGSDAAAASHCGSCRPPGAATVDANYLVIEEILKFREAWKSFERAGGPNFFLMPSHPFSSKITARTLPQFASSALYHAAETSSTMRNYHQDWQTPAGIPETMLQRAYRKKIKKSDAAAAGTHSSPWCIPL
nr:uncharacterized protein LOC105477966 isoform X1 [Macaca nemestrina]XP_011733187.1 uncharacterized protein LOC105477966 isoform X1 [Macaca nemestrina]